MKRAKLTVPTLLLAVAAQASAPDRGKVLAIHASHDDDASSIYVLGDRPLSFTTLKLAGPPRVVVDFADADVEAEDRELQVEDGVVQRIAVAAAGARTARLVIELSHEAEFDVRALEKRVEVRIPRHPVETPAGDAAEEAEKRASLPEVALVGPHTMPRAQDAKRVADQGPKEGAGGRRKVASAGQRRAITGIGFRPVRGGEVIVRSDHPLEYGVSGDGRAVLLHLPSAAIPLPNNRRPLDTRYFDGPVQRIVPVAVAGGTDLRIELKETADYQLEQSGSVLTVSFAKGP